MYIEQLKEMFAEMAVKKNVDAIPVYYHPEFKLITNGIEMDYQRLVDDHEKIYATDIQYKFVYDEDTLIEQGNKVAGRIFITVSNPGEEAREIELLIIAEYKDEKLYRVWELTYPDWSKMGEFEVIA